MDSLQEDDSPAGGRGPLPDRGKPGKSSSAGETRCTDRWGGFLEPAPTGHSMCPSALRLVMSELQRASDIAGLPYLEDLSMALFCYVALDMSFFNYLQGSLEVLGK